MYTIEILYSTIAGLINIVIVMKDATTDVTKKDSELPPEGIAVVYN